MKFKDEFNLIERKQESARVLQKYDDRVPIICEKQNRSFMREIDKKKYLVPNDLTCGQFMYVIRKRLCLPADKAIFLFVNGTVPSSNEIVGQVYDRCKDLDGFLYMNYSDENVFG